MEIFKNKIYLSWDQYIPISLMVSRWKPFSYFFKGDVK